jgi:hexosaminidase
MRLIDANINQLRNRTTGFILTGWQRFQHFEVLCELLPVAIPSLLANLLFLNRRTLVRAPDLIDQVRRTLNCSSSSSGVFDDVNYAIPQSAMHFMNCTFPGAQVFDDIEMIRYRKWKIKRHLNDAIMTDQMIVELRRLIDDLRHHMNQIYFANTIDEWIQTNVYAFIDDIEMRRRNNVND